jgi:hypothetical protein
MRSVPESAWKTRYETLGQIETQKLAMTLNY